MRADLRGAASALALGAALASVGYAAFAIHRVRAFGRRVREAEHRPTEHDDRSMRHAGASQPRPSVTILKPVHGVEPALEENLRSFCVQNYAPFDVVFGVLGPDDPALDVIRRVGAEFAGRTTVVAGDGVARFRNPKIATLAAMIAHAKGDVLVIADSDMRVTPDYLDAVVTSFADPRVGAVTCIYRGEPAANDIASLLGAMCITEQFAPSVLVANALEPVTYCFGSTMAVRRDLFGEIGGLAALGDDLADDFTLGRLVAERGRRVAVADYVVANVVAERGVRGLFEHELRWARTIRTVRRARYPGIALTYPVPLALLHLAVSRNRRRALAVLAVALVARIALSRAAHYALGERRAPSPLLIPLRDAFGIAVWARGLTGRGIRWRDKGLQVSGDGTLDPLRRNRG
jgi:ceramide glucosyltransferase